MTEPQLRQHVVDVAKGWLGCKESNGSHRKIIDLYNTQKPLPRGYKVKYTDAWCATYVTAVAMKAGTLSVIAPECGCGKMIEGFRKMGCWVENDAYVPKMADYIIYNWNDNGVGECTTGASHVGIVCSCDGKTMQIIEGNMSNAVGYRTLKVNARYIRGFGVPNYAKLCSSAPTTPAAKPDTTPVSNTGDNKPYVVVAGDTLGKIAAKYKTTATKLAELNGIANMNLIRVGQKIYPNSTVAINALTAMKIINSPDYWITLCNSGKVAKLDALFVQATLKSTAGKPRASTADLGMQYLQDAGIIKPADVAYWTGIRANVQNMDSLMMALGGAVH